MCAQACLTLCGSLDYGPPGSSAHGILQASVLEWVAMLSSRGSSWPRDQAWASYNSCIVRWVLYHWCHLGSPNCFYIIKVAHLFSMRFMIDFYWHEEKHMVLIKKSEIYSKVAQLCLTLCDPMDDTVHGLLQARILEWVAFPFSRGSSQPRDGTQVSRIADHLPAEPQGKPTLITV